MTPIAPDICGDYGKNRTRRSAPMCGENKPAALIKDEECRCRRSPRCRVQYPSRCEARSPVSGVGRYSAARPVSIPGAPLSRGESGPGDAPLSCQYAQTTGRTDHKSVIIRCYSFVVSDRTNYGAAHYWGSLGPSPARPGPAIPTQITN
jgi:hypothetical protein